MLGCAEQPVGLFEAGHNKLCGAFNLWLDFLTSCQPQGVIKTIKYYRKQMHISKLFSGMWPLSQFKSAKADCSTVIWKIFLLKKKSASVLFCKMSCQRDREYLACRWNADNDFHMRNTGNGHHTFQTGKTQMLEITELEALYSYGKCTAYSEYVHITTG